MPPWGALAKRSMQSPPNDPTIAELAERTRPNASEKGALFSKEPKPLKGLDRSCIFAPAADYKRNAHQLGAARDASRTGAIGAARPPPPVLQCWTRRPADANP